MTALQCDLPEKPVLKQIFDSYAEESVTDEEVERVLAPVLAMIHAGMFDHPQYYYKHSIIWMLQPLFAVAVVVGLIIFTVAVR